MGGGGEVAVLELIEVDSADTEIIQHIQKYIFVIPRCFFGFGLPPAMAVNADKGYPGTSADSLSNQSVGLALKGDLGLKARPAA